MNPIKIIFLLLIMPLFSYAQYNEEEFQRVLNNSSEQELVAECSQMLQEGYFYQAGRVTDRLLTLKPESCNYNYRRGFIYLEMSGDYIKALPLLEKSITDTDKNFDVYSANEKSAPVDAIYHLAQCYHLSEDIPKAEQYYRQFIEQSNPRSEFVFFAKLRLQQCEVARKLMETPKKVQLQNIGNAVNTNKPEFSPVISLDGSALYFTSRRDWENGESDAGIDPRYNLPPEDIYVSYRDFDQTWTTPNRLDFCDPIQNEATMAVSSDERRVYLYQDTRGNGDIFYSDFSTNRFQEVKHYDVPKVNTPSWEPHCTVTPDGQTMYFVSDRPGGLGGRDIYRIVKLPTGEWSEPQNCGPTINSALDEDSPFIAVDNKTLYFSSNDARSMGGFDVFVAIRDENNNWSNPINLGYPLNSAGDDLFYTTTVDGLTGYLTSFRKDGLGEKDIYEIKNDYLGVKNLAVLKGKIRTVDNEPLPDDVSITLRCTNCGDAFDRKVFPRMRDGIFLSSLEPCRSYEMIFSYENGEKAFYTETFETACDKDYDEIYREVLLDTKNKKMIPPPTVVVVEPVVEPVTTVAVKEFTNLDFKHYFRYNANKLSSKYGELNTFLKTIEQQLADGRTNITINIYASASRVPTAAYGGSNKRLTQVRAQNMKNDLDGYFNENPQYKDRVTVVIVSAVVGGPTYNNDYKNTKKYAPFQFVALKTK